MVWYDGGYAHLINIIARTPWGNGGLSMGLKMSRVLGSRYYELSEHLGNVLATVLDRKTGLQPTAPGGGSSMYYSYWKADIATATDYYPFGMEMPGRTYIASIGLSSKFGFNGKEKDNEIAGVGNSLEFQFRGIRPTKYIFSSRVMAASFG